MAPRPNPRAQLMALTALVLDGAQADPLHKPPERLVEWQREIATQLDVLPRHPETFRDLLDGILLLHRALKGSKAAVGATAPDGPPEDPEAPLAGAATAPAAVN